jgi:hypothetical protein
MYGIKISHRIIGFFLISSPVLNAQVSFSDCPLSGVRLSVCPFVLPSVCPSVNFYIFDFSRTTCPILTRLGTNHPWVKGIQVCFRGENSERVKIHWQFLEIFFRTSRPNAIKLGTNYPRVKGIQVCSNKGPGPLQRGDNHKNMKLGWGHLKIFFSRTTRLILARLRTNHPLVKGIHVCSKEGGSLFPRGDNSERVKIHWKLKKNLLHQNQQNKKIKLGTNYPWAKGIQVWTN